MTFIDKFWCYSILLKTWSNAIMKGLLDPAQWIWSEYSKGIFDIFNFNIFQMYIIMFIAELLYMYEKYWLKSIFYWYCTTDKCKQSVR